MWNFYHFDTGYEEGEGNEGGDNEGDQVRPPPTYQSSKKLPTLQEAQQQQQYATRQPQLQPPTDAAARSTLTFLSPTQQSKIINASISQLQHMLIDKELELKDAEAVCFQLQGVLVRNFNTNYY